MDVKWLLSDGTIDKINHNDPDINLHLYRNFREVFGEDNLGLLNMSSLKDEIRKNKGSGVYKLDEGLRPYLSSQRGVESKLFLAGGFSVRGENIITRNGLKEVVNYLHDKEREGKIGSLVNSKYSTLFEDKISFVDLYESGFPVPKTQTFDNFSDFFLYLKDQGPQVVKHRFGFDGVENFFVDKENCSFMKSRDISNYIVQEPLEIESESRHVMYNGEVLGSRTIYDRAAPWENNEFREHLISSYSPDKEDLEMSKKIFRYADATIGGVDIANLKSGEKKVLEFNGVAIGYGYPGAPYDLNAEIPKRLRRDFLKNE